MLRLQLIIPVYNDWVSFRILLQELDKFAATSCFKIFVTAVNDGSTEAPDVLQHILFIVGCDSRTGAIIYSKRKIVRGFTFVTRRAGK
jgi:hypothetical protein